MEKTKPPPEANRYNSPKIIRLVHFCSVLQSLVGLSSVFFLAVRDAQRITGASGQHQAAAFLAGLVRDGILTEVQKGSHHRATRFRFNMNAPKPAEPTKNQNGDIPVPG